MPISTIGTRSAQQALLDHARIILAGQQARSAQTARAAEALRGFGRQIQQNRLLEEQRKRQEAQDALAREEFTHEKGEDIFQRGLSDRTLKQRAAAEFMREQGRRLGDAATEGRYARAAEARAKKEQEERARRGRVTDYAAGSTRVTDPVNVPSFSVSPGGRGTSIRQGPGETKRFLLPRAQRPKGLELDEFLDVEGERRKISEGLTPFKQKPLTPYQQESIRLRELERGEREKREAGAQEARQAKLDARKIEDERKRGLALAVASALPKELPERVLAGVSDAGEVLRIYKSLNPKEDTPLRDALAKALVSEITGDPNPVEAVTNPGAHAEKVKAALRRLAKILAMSEEDVRAEIVGGGEQGDALPPDPTEVERLVPPGMRAEFDAKSPEEQSEILRLLRGQGD